MKFSKCEPQWVEIAKTGKLEEAYRAYLPTLKFQSLIQFHCVLSKVFDFAAPIFVRILKRAKRVDTSDTAVPLHEEFLLFWKKPDAVGWRLFCSILGHYFETKQIPLRAVLWLIHWLAFQGRYNECLILIRKFGPAVPKDARIYGEWIMFVANYLYVRGRTSLAEKYHRKAHKIFKSHGDRFFEYFNLGLWIRISARNGSLKDLREMVQHFDNVDPDSPNEWYGLRLLTYCAYTHIKAGNIEIGNRFLNSANNMFFKSESTFDKAVFKLLASSISLMCGRLATARQEIDEAKSFIKEFGRYKFIEELIDAYALYLNDPKAFAASRVQNRYKRAIFDTSAVEISLESHIEFRDSHVRDRDWYYRFFNETLSIFDKINSIELDQILDVIKKQSCAEAFSSSIGEDSENAAPYLRITEEPPVTKFQFNLLHRGHQVRVEMEVPFLEWRNADICVSIRSMVLSVQALSFQEESLRAIYENNKNHEVNEAIRKIAHDIRSPLMTFDNILDAFKSSSGIPAQLLEILDVTSKRIKEITDEATMSLKSLNSPVSGSPSSKKLMLKIERLEKLISSIVDSKRFEFKDRPNTRIEVEVQDSLSAQVIPMDFERIISNLLNNSYEATAANGYIKIRLSRNAEEAIIEISDNGVGVPKSVQKQLFNEGFSYNKKTGFGLGLYHAKKTLAAWHGTIELQSEVKKGTKVQITLPAAPSMSVPAEIVLPIAATALILDDDTLVHTVWKQKIRANGDLANLRWLHFYRYDDAETWLEENQHGEHLYCFFDYDLGNSSPTGLDLLRNHDLVQNIYLVTNRFDDPVLIRQCEELGIRLLPKTDLHELVVNVSHTPLSQPAN